MNLKDNEVCTFKQEPYVIVCVCCVCVCVCVLYVQYFMVNVHGNDKLQRHISINVFVKAIISVTYM